MLKQAHLAISEWHKRLFVPFAGGFISDCLLQLMQQLSQSQLLFSNVTGPLLILLHCSPIVVIIGY